MPFDKSRELPSLAERLELSNALLRQERFAHGQTKALVDELQAELDRLRPLSKDQRLALERDEEILQLREANNKLRQDNRQLIQRYARLMPVEKLPAAAPEGSAPC